MAFAKRLSKPFLGGMVVLLFVATLVVSLIGLRSHQALAATDNPALHRVVSITTNSSNVFVFKPKTLTISVGMKVVWINKTQVEHTATSDDGTTFNSGPIAPGGKFGFVFTKKGTFTYHCTFHPFMTGTIIVN